MNNYLIEGRPKSDIVFYKAFKDAANNKQSYAILKFLLFASMATLTVLNLTIFERRSNDLIQSFIVNAVVSLFGLILQLSQFCTIFSKPQIFLRMAETHGHIVAQELTSNVVTIEDCVSTKVFIGLGNLYETDLNEPTKKAYINAISKALSLELSLRYKGYSSLARLHSVLSIVSLINSIVLLGQDPAMNSLNKGFLIGYVVLVGLSELIVIAVFILIILSPILCCLCCFYICCCRVTKGEGLNVPTKNASMEDILNCDGTCSICYQNIGQNEQIYVLPCSNKHVFHKDCLGHWCRVKNTCPICRAEIPMGGAAAYLPSDQ